MTPGIFRHFVNGLKVYHVALETCWTLFLSHPGPSGLHLQRTPRPTPTCLSPLPYSGLGQHHFSPASLQYPPTWSSCFCSQVYAQHSSYSHPSKQGTSHHFSETFSGPSFVKWVKAKVFRRGLKGFRLLLLSELIPLTRLY